jgi:hypothetical protein
VCISDVAVVKPLREMSYARMVSQALHATYTADTTYAAANHLT